MSPYPDFEAVDKFVHEAYALAGFVTTDRAGVEQAHDEAVKDKVYQIMVDQHVVEDPGKMTRGAVTPQELYQAVFPDGPGAHSQPQTLEEEEARERLVRKCWNYVATGVTSYVNKRVELEGLTYVMCETLVARTYKSEETGKSNPTTELGRFLTDNTELIAHHSTEARAAKLIKAAEAIAKHMGMTVRRHPEMSAVVARQISSALKQSQGALGPASKPVPRIEDDEA